ncbi:hypothetical protein AAGS40_21400 [Paraburkholderia sp. PREW-6R]|uniref:hypothetical protein n=1 Tax=Paraburkholderia sp. PREW-6R TaxID=3141544 RepID=UPI0031F55E5E
MILSVSHSPSARFRRLRNIFGFLPVNDGARAQAPGMDASPDAGPVSGAEISRARRLLQGIESVRVRFPTEFHDVLMQAETAYAKRRWTRHVDRIFSACWDARICRAARQREAGGARWPR